MMQVSAGLASLDASNKTPGDSKWARSGDANAWLAGFYEISQRRFVIHITWSGLCKKIK